MIYQCCSDNRRAAVAAHPTLNGIDFLEVLDQDAPDGSPRQRTLMLHLLKEVPPAWNTDNVRITGGERVRDPQIEWVAGADNLPVGELNADEISFFTALDNAERILIIRTETNGDFSEYCLSLQQASDNQQAPPGFDPQLISIPFSFKVECPSDFDCQQEQICNEDLEPQPDINYLAKDYASFRKLIIDRMTYLMPDWKSRVAADLGVTLAEVVAYAGDQLSYWQDAVTTEAYLNTARKRISLRRHALMVDYRISEGRNARAWLHLHVSGGPFQLSTTDLQFLTRVDGLRDPEDNRIEPDSKQYTLARQNHTLVFELLHNTPLQEEHNELHFYTWGETQCCIPQGATKADLVGHHSELEVTDEQIGKFILLEEVLGPNTGIREDADPKHRQIVRITHADLDEDPLDGSQITTIYWSQADALQFPLCVSSINTNDPDNPSAIDNVSVARGNIILVDHGETIDENLGRVPESWLYYANTNHAKFCAESARERVPPRFRPRLGFAPLSHGAASPDNSAPASGLLTPDLEQIKPLVKQLNGDDGFASQPWSIHPDLLNSDNNDTHAVVELDNNGSATLRFGDDQNGARPNSGTEFTIRYRIGNGPSGNVGAESINHIVSLDGRVNAVRNPLPAQGGLSAETPEQIRRRAPQAFRTQLRAVTPQDYADFTSALDGVQQAAATPRWTGSWYTQTVTVDREGGLPLDDEFEGDLAANLERYRMAGHDLNFNEPVFISLQLDMQVCVSRDYFRSDVQQAILEIFNSGVQANGELGLFHPDNFSFGQTIYLSPYYALARQIPGVSSVQITRFSRQDDDNPQALIDGFMQLGRLEIARLDNNPNFPEHGVLKLTMLGGK